MSSWLAVRQTRKLGIWAVRGLLVAYLVAIRGSTGPTAVDSKKLTAAGFRVIYASFPSFFCVAQSAVFLVATLPGGMNSPYVGPTVRQHNALSPKGNYFAYYGGPGSWEKTYLFLIYLAPTCWYHRSGSDLKGHTHAALQASLQGTGKPIITGCSLGLVDV